MINCLDPHADQIVVFGMSCSGKTTFAKALTDHYYYCFDAFFRWSEIEGLGLSVENNLRSLQNECCVSRYVLDGWHWTDASGEFLPSNACIYVVYRDYAEIVQDYRIPLSCFTECLSMFERWYYFLDYERMTHPVRFFRNQICFQEVTLIDFLAWRCVTFLSGNNQ